MAAFLSVDMLYAQAVFSDVSEEIVEQLYTDEEEEERSVENLLEDLSDLRTEPINLNTATKEQLKRFPFLSDIQIENMLYYLYVTGGMRTIYELQLVESMDRQTISYLLPFVCLGKPDKQPVPSVKNMLRYGKNTLVARTKLPLHPDEQTKTYAGSPVYHSLRYGFHYKDRLYFGLTAEKDAGEPFFAGANKKGYDYYSFYFLFRGTGHLRALALGNYRLNFGMGLVMNTNFGMGKTSSLATMGYRSSGISKHSSADEYNYLQGIASEFRFKRFLLTGFYSCRRLDATVQNGLITSLKKDGLHRTELDFRKREKVVMQTFGGHVGYVSGRLQLGLTGVYNCFNKLFMPELKPYNVFYPRGKSFYACGADYRYRLSRLSFSGETAICGSGGIAMLHVLRFLPLPDCQVVFLQRYYDRRYYSWFARSVSEGTEVRNENGCYMGVETTPFKYWKFVLYADFFRFPWLRYGIDKPSGGFDGLVQATYSPRKALSMSWRYQYKVKDKNCPEPDGAVLPHVRHKLRYQLACLLEECFSFRVLLDYLSVRPQGGDRSCGLLLFQQLSYRFQQFPLQLSVHYALFDTDDYSSRLTVYERGMLYSFPFVSFYGRGSRSSLYARYDFNRYLTGIVKMSRSKYKETADAGKNSRSDVDCQLVWKF